MAAFEIAISSDGTGGVFRWLLMKHPNSAANAPAIQSMPNNTPSGGRFGRGGVWPGCQVEGAFVQGSPQVGWTAGQAGRGGSSLHVVTPALLQVHVQEGPL